MKCPPVVRIKQEIKESSEPFAQYAVRSPEDAQKLAASYIADEDREVLLVMMLNTKNQVVGLHRAHATDKTVKEICTITGVSQAAFYRRLKEMEQDV